MAGTSFALSTAGVFPVFRRAESRAAASRSPVEATATMRGTRQSYAAASSMSEVTRILSELKQGDRFTADELLPLVYEALRQLAAQRLAQEPAGQTLQATALVHEAFLRLLDRDCPQQW